MIFQVQSVKEQIAENILHEIRSGKILPGTKLKSIRELAREYSVSTQSILGAMDILEKQGVVKRDSGSGITVRNPKEGRLNLGLLALSDTHRPNTYFSFLNRMISDFDADREIILTTWRTTLKKRTTLPEFTRQVQFLERQLNIDCLLLSAPMLTKGQIGAFCKFKCPVIILGDFAAGPYDNIPCSQIINDNYIGYRNAVQKLLVETGMKKLIFFIGSLEYHYYRQAHDGIFETCRSFGFEPQCLEMPKGFSLFSDAEKEYVITRAIAGVDISNSLALTMGLPAGIVHEYKKKHNLNIQCYSLALDEISRQEYAGKVFAMIDRKIDGDLRNETVTFIPKYTAFPAEIMPGMTIFI